MGARKKVRKRHKQGSSSFTETETDSVPLDEVEEKGENILDPLEDDDEEKKVSKTKRLPRLKAPTKPVVQE